MKHLLKNASVVSGTACEIADVLIEDEKILQVAASIAAEDAQVTDLTGKLIFPGFIDAHTHFDLEAAGTVTADDFEWGSKAAVAGGTTLVIDFATQNKGETLQEALANWHKKADGRTSCDYAFHMAISDWNAQAKSQIQDMIAQGVTTFKLYMTYEAMMLNDGELYQVIRALKEEKTFAGVHCENADVIDALIAEARESGCMGPDMQPRVRPAQLEAEAVNRILAIAKTANAPVMVVHLTCEEALAEIRAARKRGQHVLAETCPQYLLLDEGYYEKPGFESAKYVCSPPLRKRKDQDCLWEALKNGEIQTIATDHCSFSMAQKKLGKGDFTKIPSGMPGVETRGVLLYTYGVGTGRITLSEMCKLLAENPARLYGVYPQKGCIQVGSDADIVVLDPDMEKIITAKEQMYHMDYAPFEGMKIKGCIDKVFLRGMLVVDGGKLETENQGHFIKRGLPRIYEDLQ